MEQFEFQKVLILKILDIIDRMLEWLRSPNYSQWMRSRPHQERQQEAAVGQGSLGLQILIVAANGRFDEEMAIKVVSGEVKLPGNILSVI